MSAENGFEFFKMENGEFWICVVRCGDTILECYGENCGVVGKANSYDELCEVYKRISYEPQDDDNCEDYVYTEHGGVLPSREYIENMRESWLKS